MKIFAAANINVAKFLSNSYLLIFLKASPFPMVPLFPPKYFPPFLISQLSLIRLTVPVDSIDTFPFTNNDAPLNYQTKPACVSLFQGAFSTMFPTLDSFSFREVQLFPATCVVRVSRLLRHRQHGLVNVTRKTVVRQRSLCNDKQGAVSWNFIGLFRWLDGGRAPSISLQNTISVLAQLLSFSCFGDRSIFFTAFESPLSVLVLRSTLQTDEIFEFSRLLFALVIESRHREVTTAGGRQFTIAT